MLYLIYGKADLAATVFDHGAHAIPQVTRDACARFFSRLKGDGGWRQRFRHRVDRWVRKV